MCPECKKEKLEPVATCYRRQLKALGDPGLLPFLAPCMSKKYDNALYRLQPPIKSRIIDIIGIWSLVTLVLWFFVRELPWGQGGILLLLLPLVAEQIFQWRMARWFSKKACYGCKSIFSDKVG